MKVKDLVKACLAQYYEIKDATQPGFISTNNKPLITADRNIVTERHGEKEVVLFEPKSPYTLTIYVK